MPVLLNCGFSVMVPCAGSPGSNSATTNWATSAGSPANSGRATPHTVALNKRYFNLTRIQLKLTLVWIIYCVPSPWQPWQTYNGQLKSGFFQDSFKILSGFFQDSFRDLLIGYVVRKTQSCISIFSASSAASVVCCCVVCYNPNQICENET